MHYWDLETRTHDIERRLGRLRPRNRLAFALASTSHAAAGLYRAYDGVYVESERTFTLEVSGLANDCWSCRLDPGRLPVVLAAVAARMDEVESSPRELPGQYELYWSLQLALVALQNACDTAGLLDSVFQSYYAVCQFSVLGPGALFRGGTTAEMCAYEATSPACVAEVSSQMSTLAELERIDTAGEIGDYRQLFPS